MNFHLYNSRLLTVRNFTVYPLSYFRGFACYPVSRNHLNRLRYFTLTGYKTRQLFCSCLLIEKNDIYVILPRTYMSSIFPSLQIKNIFSHLANNSLSMAYQPSQNTKKPLKTQKNHLICCFRPLTNRLFCIYDGQNPYVVFWG